MKILKEREIERILRAKDSNELKRILKIKREDYFTSFIYKLERLIYNYSAKYDSVIYKILEITLEDVLKDNNYLNKCLKISEFRKSSFNIFEYLEKRVKRDNFIYDEFKGFKEYLSYIDKQFDLEIKKGSITNSFEEVVNYLENVLKIKDFDNMDVINKLLNFLDNNLKEEQEVIVERCKKINELKKMVKNSKDKHGNNEGEHVLDFIYHKLDKIEINISDSINKDNKSFNNFASLLSYLTELMDSFTENHASAVYKILEALENEILKGKQLDFLEESEKILKIRQEIVERIKSVKKNERKSHQKYFYLKDIANRLENIELNMAYKIKSSEVVNNYNIVRYILFDLEDTECMERLIKKNPYIINAFNLKSVNILYLVVDKYMKAILNKDTNFYQKVCYYDTMLESILNSKFIRIEEEVLDKCMGMVTAVFKKILREGKSNELVSSWYRNLLSRLKGDEVPLNKADLDKMYGVSKAIYCKPLKDDQLKQVLSLDDFIVTIDEDILSNKDDAIAVKRVNNDLFELKTFISDPNSLYSMNSLPIKGARESAETIYYEDSKEDMFHKDIISKYLSLDEGILRNVRVYQFLIDKSGELVSFDIKKGPIKVSKNYSYDEINDCLKMCYDERLDEYISNLNLLKNILVKKGFDTNIGKDSSYSKAEELVMIFMIYTNHKVAEYCAKNDIPFVYRYYNDDKKEVDKSILDTISLEKRNIYARYLDEIGKLSNSAFYSTEGKSHDALGLGYYTHLTSPNRRFADILANQCIDNFYFNNLDDKNREFFEKYLKKEVAKLNDKLRGLDNYYREYSKYVLTRK